MISISPLPIGVTDGYQRWRDMSAPWLQVSFSQSKTCVLTIPSSFWFLLPPAMKRFPFVICARPLQKTLKPSWSSTSDWLPVVGSQTVASV